MSSKFREGDIIETVENAFFDVKGLVHPPDKVVAFVRFVPHPQGDRERDGVLYRKVYALYKRYALLKKTYPQYLVYDPVFNERLCEVPIEAISRHYMPVHRLGELRREGGLDETEKLALRFITLLKDDAQVCWGKLGISGSILIGLHTLTSDIDPIVYGSENCHRAHSALEVLQKNEKIPVTSYDQKELKELFIFRSKDTNISFEDFAKTESRKALQGKFMGRDYFLRFVKDWNEIGERYGKTSYTSRGYAKIKARIVDDSEAIFTPCRYEIGDVEILDGEVSNQIREIVSFRGRFCEQARKGEIVIAQGKVEIVQTEHKPEYYRLLLGNKVSDYMILG
ncbi:MAG: hypothetical protein ACE5L6_04475 [Candidatus Bathyarchaeia archaeon]